jgi:threonine dehydrogenase-like Zn-dependent dehydrogenase
MDVVIETGPGVTLKKGDRIVLSFNVADGHCRNCEEGRTAFCTGVNPGFAGGAGERGSVWSGARWVDGGV